MSRRVLFICLALVVVSTSYATVTFPPWDGWTSPYWPFPPEPPIGNDPLSIVRDDTGLAITLQNDALYPYLSEMSVPGARLEMDVHWIESEWAGTNVWANWSYLAINSSAGWSQFNPEWGPGPHPILPVAHWEPGYGEVYFTSFVYDISGYNWAAAQGGWLQLMIATNTSGTITQNGAFYVDEIRIIPEPATIALLGLGGLALIRRKR